MATVPHKKKASPCVLFASLWVGIFYRFFFERRADGREFLKSAPVQPPWLSVVRAPVPGGARLYRPDSQGRTEGRHLRPDGRGEAGSTGQTRSHSNPQSGHPFR